MKRILIASLIAVVVTAASFAGAASAPIKIGGNFELTGGAATFGTSSANSAQLAIDAVNKKGGILGRKLELVMADNKSEASEAASAAKKLISQDKVVALIGPLTTKNCLSAAPIAQGAKIPMMSPAATDPSVTKQGNFIFRACFLDDFQGVVMATFATKTLKIKTAAIFIDNANDYSKALAKFFKERFVKNGGQVIEEEAFMAGDKDFRTQLTKIKMKNPGLIYVPAYYQEDGLIAKQARELGMKMPIMGGDGWDSADLVKIAGEKVLNNIYFSNHYSADNRDAQSLAYVKAYQARFKSRPDAFAALGYDGALILVNAIKTAHSADPEKIRAALVKTKMKGITGQIRFDANRNPQKSAMVIELKNGKQTYKTSVQPD